MNETVTLDSLYKLIGLAVTVIAFLLTIATAYLRLYIAKVAADISIAIRGEMKLDYMTKDAARVLEKDIARLEK